MQHPLSTYALTGLAPVESNYVGHGPTQQMAHGEHDLGGIFHPDNPLFWFGALLAVSVGLVGVSGTVRVGKAKVTGSAGTS